MHMKKQTWLMIGLATLLASPRRPARNNSPESIQDTHLETTRTSEQLKATLSALNALTTQKRGRPPSSLQHLLLGSDQDGRRPPHGPARGPNGWPAMAGSTSRTGKLPSMASPTNPCAKKSQKRLDAVKVSYDKVEASLQQAGEKFKPFLSDLSDIQKALATDVTAGGVKAIRSTVKSANWNHQFVDKADQVRPQGNGQDGRRRCPRKPSKLR